MGVPAVVVTVRVDVPAFVNAVGLKFAVVFAGTLPTVNRLVLVVVAPWKLTVNTAALPGATVWADGAVARRLLNPENGPTSFVDRKCAISGVAENSSAPMSRFASRVWPSMS